MSNVTPLRHSDGITPEKVVQGLTDNLPNIESIYVVTIEDGRPVVSASGDLRDLCTAAVTIADFATRYLKGELE